MSMLPYMSMQAIDCILGEPPITPFSKRWYVSIEKWTGTMQDSL